MEDNLIVEDINTLCEEKNIEPLVAKERGSRMIGVTHDDSDWDVFLLFTQDLPDYIKLGTYIDTVSKKYREGDVDIHGWNIQKFASLLLGSNPNAIEFLLSEHQYLNNTGSRIEELKEHIENNFNCMALYYHYISLAKNNYENHVVSKKNCTYNRQFYIIRATLMAKHIREEGTLPKVNVWEFLEQTDSINTEEREILRDLSEKKEKGILGEASDISGKIVESEREKNMEPTEERIKKPSVQKINNFISDCIENIN